MNGALQIEDMVLEIEFPGSVLDHARWKSAGNVQLSAAVAALPVVLCVVVVVVDGVDNVHVVNDCLPLVLR